MRLCQHQDFEQAMLRAAEHFRSAGLRPSFIEKDYYVTEALRAVNLAAEGKIMFKGGTSLSKGWNLIQRFSEDIDIFLDPLAFAPPLGTNAINRELKRLRDAVSAQHIMSLVPEESQTIGGFGRSDRFSYLQHFGSSGELANRVLVEVGTASGRQPVENRELISFLAQYLKEAEISLGAEDETSFSMPLLHFRRTFVEKMFAIHDKVELLKREGRPIGSYARHYYDLYQLALTPEVGKMLSSAEYTQIRNDYDQISKAHFAKYYTPPKDLSFSASDALFPSQTLSASLAREYEVQCGKLCYGPYPAWTEVLEAFEKLRPLL
jgi:hypothetical protein